MSKPHIHQEIANLYFMDPEAFEVFYRTDKKEKWGLCKNPAFFPQFDYKLVKKEVVKTVPSRRYIYKMGPNFYIAHYYKNNIDPSNKNSFVRWIDDDFITHEVETNTVEIVSFGRHD